MNNLPQVLELMPKRLEFEPHLLVVMFICNSLYLILIQDHVTKAK